MRMSALPPTFIREPDPSTFRRIAACMWGRPSDPTIYGSMDVDATDLLAFVARSASAPASASR